MIGETEPTQSRHGQQRGMNLAAIEFGQPRLHVSAQKRHLQIRPHTTDLGLPAQRRGAHDAAFGKLAVCL